MLKQINKLMDDQEKLNIEVDDNQIRIWEYEKKWEKRLKWEDKSSENLG